MGFQIFNSSIFKFCISNFLNLQFLNFECLAISNNNCNKTGRPRASKRKTHRINELESISEWLAGWPAPSPPEEKNAELRNQSLLFSVLGRGGPWGGLAQLLPPTIQTGPFDQFDQASHFACHRSSCPGSFCCSLGTKLRNPSNHE